MRMEVAILPRGWSSRETEGVKEYMLHARSRDRHGRGSRTLALASARLLYSFLLSPGAVPCKEREAALRRRTAPYRFGEREERRRRRWSENDHADDGQERNTRTTRERCAPHV